MNTALITGAGRGIGLATVRAFLAAGWRVLALDRNFSGFDEKAAVRIEFDLSELDQIPKLISSLGEIHALVNNAGVHNALPYDKYADEARRRILRINLEVPAALISALAPQMIARRSGRIVNLASIASWQAHPDLWYGVTKAGVVSLTRSFASYLGRHGIQVNAVAPGPVDTEMMKIIDAPRREALLKQVYSGRMGTPDEIAAAILWLATACPSTVNGSVLDINDGTHLR